MTENICWTLDLSIADGKTEELKALAAEMSEATKNDEPGTLSYQWYFSADGKHCHLLERYVDNAAAMAHLGNFGSKFAGRFMELVKPTAFDVYGPADATLRGALADFGAKHFERFSGFTR